MEHDIFKKCISYLESVKKCLNDVETNSRNNNETDTNTVKIIDEELQKKQKYENKMRNGMDRINKILCKNLCIHLSKTRSTFCTCYSDDGIILCQKICGKYISFDNTLSMGYPILQKTSNTSVRLLLSLGIAWDKNNETFVLDHVEIGEVEKKENGIYIRSTITFTNGDFENREGTIPYNSITSFRDIIPLYSDNDIDVKLYSSIIHIIVDAQRKKFCVQIDNCPLLIHRGCNNSQVSMFTVCMAHFSKYNNTKEDDVDNVDDTTTTAAATQNLNVKRILRLYEMKNRTDDVFLDALISFLKEKIDTPLPILEDGETMVHDEIMVQKLKLEKIITLYKEKDNTEKGNISYEANTHHDEEKDDILTLSNEATDKNDHLGALDWIPSLSSEIKKHDEEKDAILALSNELADKIDHLEVLDWIPSLSSEVEKCESIRDISLLGYYNNPYILEKSKEKRKRPFLLLREIKEIGGYTTKLKALFKEIRSMASDEELTEFNFYYEEYVNQMESMYKLSLMNDQIWEEGYKIRRIMRLFITASVFSPRYPIVNKILNKEKKKYLRYVLRNIFSGLIISMKPDHNFEANKEWVIRVIIDHLSDNNNKEKFVDVLRFWMSEFQIYSTGRYWLDGISTTNGSLEKNPLGGGPCALFTPIAKHMRMIKFNSTGTDLPNIESKNGTVYHELSPIDSLHLLIDLTKRRGGLLSIGFSNKDDNTDCIADFNLKRTNLINSKHIFRPFKYVNKMIRRDHTLNTADNFNLDFIDIFLNQKHWIEILRNGGVLRLVTVGKNKTSNTGAVPIVHDTRDCNDIDCDDNDNIEKDENNVDTNNKDKYRYNEVNVMSSLYDEYGKTINYIPLTMAYDIKRLLGDEGYKRAMQTQAPSKIKMLIYDYNNNHATQIDVDSFYKRCDLNITPFPIQYVSSMFVPRYNAMTIKRKTTTNQRRDENKIFDIVFKDYQTKCNHLLREMDNINKQLVKLKGMKRSLVSKLKKRKGGPYNEMHKGNNGKMSKIN